MKRLCIIISMWILLASCSPAESVGTGETPLLTSEESRMGFLPLNRVVRSDLNGDGAVENIKYNGIDLTIEGDSYKDVIETERFTKPDLTNFLIVDLTTSDKQVEIALKDEGRNGRPTTRFYTFDGLELKALGVVDAAITSLDAFDGKGYIRGQKVLDVLQNWTAEAVWQYNRGRIREVIPSTYQVNASEEVVLKLELPVYDNLGDDVSYRNLSPQNVRLLETDNVGWVMVQGRNGEKGWFKVRGREITDLKKPAREVFEGLN